MRYNEQSYQRGVSYTSKGGVLSRKVYFIFYRNKEGTQPCPGVDFLFQRLHHPE